MKIETTTGRPSEGVGWYDKTGRVVYEVRGANGQMRMATLRDARKLGLLPRVSAVLAVEAKPMLERWKVEQGILSALTLPRAEGESADAFLIRCREDSQEQARKAREKGTELHALVQAAFEGARTPEHYIPFVQPTRSWIAQRYGLEDWHAEASFAHPRGYGGKSDLVSRTRGIVVDFKCKDFDESKDAKDLAWPEHIAQLAAYADGFGFEKPDCINIFISTTVPGLIRVREWDDEEIADGREVFGLLLKLWKLRKKYNGSFNPQEIAA
jgi:hypothetical protein